MHKNGTLSIMDNNVLKENIYIQSVTLNGKPYFRNYLRHEDIFSDNTKLAFKMGKTSNKKQGCAVADLPPSHNFNQHFQLAFEQSHSNRIV